MKAVVCESFGSPEVMRIADVPAPAAGAGQVLIDVKAASVNRPDVMQRLGHYPPPPGESEILGLELA
ncbi:MAG: NAD(P)H-quinone oxidoreductase, partial [Gammaproteobacteria bacterium]|nr:NAD(P)H-quinone oxidoreductase [Gammaproteobacteria bacterium]